MALARGDPFRISGEPDICDNAKTRVFALSADKEIMTLALFVLMQYRSVTDRQTDGPTGRPAV